ncbi:MAG TPA: TGS domain-containing protein, partial [Bacteroidales bacterium]|nr:TGS domain-containing protein [Bacteroidales bacterium]
ERGFAAHYRYKEENRTPVEYENRVEDWLERVREMLKSEDTNALEFLNEVKMNLDLKEVVIFTPKGDRKLLPKGSTVLDFAYSLHTSIGDQCIGAKVNYNIVSIEHVLQSGDQVEVITSKKQFPKTEWLSIVKTAHARESIKDTIRSEQKKQVSAGKEQLRQIFSELDIPYSKDNIGRIQADTRIASVAEFWSHIAQGVISFDRIKSIFKGKGEYRDVQKKIAEGLKEKSLDKLIYEQLEEKPEVFFLDETSDSIRHIIASCCSPLPGDQVVGFQISNELIEVHMTNCPKAIEQMSKFGNRIIKAKWYNDQDIGFLSGLSLAGFDRKGIIKEIVDIVTQQLDLNIRTIEMSTKNGVFTGKLILYIKNVKALNELIEKLLTIDQIEQIERIAPGV